MFQREDKRVFLGDTAAAVLGREKAPKLSPSPHFQSAVRGRYKREEEDFLIDEKDGLGGRKREKRC